MPKYLRTSSITAELENLIREARKELYIISPYLKLSDQIKELLNDKEREKVDVRIIFGKQQLAPIEMSFLEGLKYIRLYFSKNLHAKCYLNENKMIIASMNLYEFSQQNNREMGILITKENTQDNEVYEDARRDIDSMIHNSEDFSYVKAPQKILQSEKKVTKTHYSKSNHKRTNDLSKETGINSRKINSILVEKGLMNKKGNDWFVTTEGKKFGGIEKEGPFGHFVIWPDEIKKLIK